MLFVFELPSQIEIRHFSLFQTLHQRISFGILLLYNKPDLLPLQRRSGQRRFLFLKFELINFILHSPVQLFPNTHVSQIIPEALIDLSISCLSLPLLDDFQSKLVFLYFGFGVFCKSA